jgi:hypothetical protein
MAKKSVLKALREQIHDGERLKKAGQLSVSATKKAAKEYRDVQVAYARLKKERMESRIAKMESKLARKTRMALLRRKELQLQRLERQIRKGKYRRTKRIGRGLVTATMRVAGVKPVPRKRRVKRKRRRRKVTVYY